MCSPQLSLDLLELRSHSPCLEHPNQLSGESSHPSLPPSHLDLLALSCSALHSPSLSLVWSCGATSSLPLV
jgi:hypothetical protein